MHTKNVLHGNYAGANTILLPNTGKLFLIIDTVFATRLPNYSLDVK